MNDTLHAWHSTICREQWKNTTNTLHIHKSPTTLYSCTYIQIDRQIDRWMDRQTHALLQHSNSTDIRSVQDNVATPVTAMMVTVCISTDVYHLYSSVLIYLIPTASISAVGPSYLLQPVLTDCNSLFPTYLYDSVTSD